MISILDGESVDVGNSKIFRQGRVITLVYAGEDGEVNDGDEQLVLNFLRTGDNGVINIVDVFLKDERDSTINGLLGNNNGDPLDDIALSNGTVLERPLAFRDLYGNYLNNWRIKNVEDSLFTYGDDTNPNTFYDPSFPSTFVTVDSLDPEVRANVEEIVRAAGVPEGTPAFNAAVLDIALTNDIGFLEGALDGPSVEEEVLPRPSIQLFVDTNLDENDGSANIGSGLSLRDAILIANNDSDNGYEIILQSNTTYTLSIRGNESLFPSEVGDLDINGNTNVRIIGLEEGATIDANGIDRVIEISSRARADLDNITITSGNSVSRIIGQGSGILNSGNLTLNNVLVTDNFGEALGVGGQGIFNTEDGILTVFNSTISQNETNGISNFGKLEISSSNIVQNSEDGIRGKGALSIVDSVVSDNGSDGIRIESGNDNTPSTLKIDNSIISRNSRFGINQGNNNNFSFIENSVILNNNFGISNFGDLNLINSEISDNKANGRSDSGGGIFHGNGDLKLVDSTISSNFRITSGGGFGTTSGGGISISSPNSVNTIVNSTISNNSSSGLGGGIDLRSGSLDIVSSTISNNSANVGGGVSSFALDDNDELRIVNSTVSNNSANRGGGISHRGLTLTLENATVSDNSAEDEGGGIYVQSFGGLVRLTNSIVANSLESVDVSVPDGSSLFEFNGSNIVEDGSISGQSILNVDPGLSPLQDNGGSTLTHLPLVGSPAINAGNNASIAEDTLDLDGDENLTETLPFDQRGIGFNRIVDGQVDLGAVEFGDSQSSLVSSTLRANSATLGSNDNLPFQSAILARPLSPISAGEPFNFDVFFIATDTEDNGLGVRFHYDSSEVQVNLSDLLTRNLIQQQDQSDTSDFDNDPNTDRYINLFWADINGQWPSQTISRLFTVNSTTSDGFDGTQFNTSISSSSGNVRLLPIEVPFRAEKEESIYLLSGIGSWQETQAQAESLGGNLVTINDADEEARLVDMFGDNRIFWIGFTDKQEEGNWQWIDGSDVTYENWAPGEPNDLVNDQTPFGEDYAVLDGTINAWNDISNTFRELPGIIEIPQEDALVYENSLYILSDAGSWEETQAQAESLGGNLVSINDADEEAWLVGALESDEIFWIGLTDKFEEGNWQWIDGSDLAYENWAPGEPNNFTSDLIPNGEDYGVIDNFKAGWNDLANLDPFLGDLKGIIEIPLPGIES